MIICETVMEELDSRGWDLSDLADKSGIHYDKLRDAINGLRPVDKQIAKGLARAFGTSEELWINLGKR